MPLMKLSIIFAVLSSSAGVFFSTIKTASSPDDRVGRRQIVTDQHTARHNGYVLLGMSAEAISAVDMDLSLLQQGLSRLASQKTLIKGARDNATQLQRAQKKLQQLGEVNENKSEALVLSMEIRSRQEGLSLMISDCRNIVFGDLAGSESFCVVAGEVSPWDKLPLPYRNSSVPATMALELVKLQSDFASTTPDNSDIPQLLDQLYAQLDSMDGVVSMRDRIRERLPRVLEALNSL